MQDKLIKLIQPEDLSDEGWVYDNDYIFIGEENGKWTFHINYANSRDGIRTDEYCFVLNEKNEIIDEYQENIEIE